MFIRYYKPPYSQLKHILYNI